MLAGLNPFLTSLTQRGLSAAALYDHWLVAETEATLSLVAWRDAPRDRKRAAYTRYRSALDAEAAAAAVLEQAAALTGAR